jgi:plastocyanin
MRWTCVIFVLLFLLAFTRNARAKSDTVRMVDFAFVPASITIAPGDTIVWRSTQQCCLLHTSTRSTGPMTWNAVVPLNTSFKLAFHQQGTFNYVCSNHAGIGMTGSVTVLSKVPSLGWLGLVLLLASLTATGLYILEKKRKRIS